MSQMTAPHPGTVVTLSGGRVMVDKGHKERVGVGLVEGHVLGKVRGRWGGWRRSGVRGARVTPVEKVSRADLIWCSPGTTGGAGGLNLCAPQFTC